MCRSGLTPEQVDEAIRLHGRDRSFASCRVLRRSTRHQARGCYEADAAVALLGRVGASSATSGQPLLSDGGRRAAISERALAHGRPDTANRLVDVVLAAAGSWQLNLNLAGCYGRCCVAPASMRRTQAVNAGSGCPHGLGTSRRRGRAPRSAHCISVWSTRVPRCPGGRSRERLPRRSWEGGRGGRSICPGDRPTGPRRRARDVGCRALWPPRHIHHNQPTILDQGVIRAFRRSAAPMFGHCGWARMLRCPRSRKWLRPTRRAARRPGCDRSRA